jgi:hypothetical protein
MHAPKDLREVLQKAVGDGHGERIAREQRRQACGPYGRLIVSVLAERALRLVGRGRTTGRAATKSGDE